MKTPCYQDYFSFLLYRVVHWIHRGCTSRKQKMRYPLTGVHVHVIRNRDRRTMNILMILYPEMGCEKFKL